MTSWRGLRSMPRACAYPLVAMALALGAPLGLLLSRAIAAGQMPTVAWARADILELPATYLGLTISVLAVFSLLGHLLGRRIDSLSLLSGTDRMTGLFHRRTFERRLSEEIGRSRRHGRTLCVLCLDIDHLEAINERLGHKAGDLAITAVSRALLANVRAADAVARLGGDEFAVLLPETSAIQATTLATRILHEVSRHDGTLMGALAVSIGIAERTGDEDVEADDLLAAADAAMVRAKAAGGGRAALATPEAVAPRTRRFTMMEASLLLDGDRRAAANDGGGPLPRPASTECPACRRAVTEVCAGSLVQQAWFRLNRQPGPCSAHQAEARGRR